MPRVLTKLAAGASAITVFTYFYAMAFGILLLIFTPIGQDLLNHQGTLLLGAFLIPVYTPVKVNLLGTFLVLLGIYGLCFLAALRTSGGFLPNLRSLLNGGPRQRIPNWLVVMPLASSALLVVVVAITVLQGVVGVPTGNLPSLPPYEFLYTLAYAPPLEEAMFRITTIGLLVSFRVLWFSATNPVGDSKKGMARLIAMSFLFPDNAKAEAGMPTVADNGWRAFHWSEWLALILTSVGFGLAHFLSNVGWDVGKIGTAALSGFALGLAYLSYGAYASILMHWFFNVYFGIFDIGSMYIPAYSIIGGIFSLLAVAVGIIGIAVLIRRIVSRLHGRRQSPYMIPSSPTSI